MSSLRLTDTDASSVPLLILLVGCFLFAWMYMKSQQVIVVQTPRWRPMDSYKVSIEITSLSLESKKDV
jgi:hypothetical protein